jgi:hypothetical protein
VSFYQVAGEERWSENRVAEGLKEIRPLADHPITTAKGAQGDADVLEWTVQIWRGANEATQAVLDVLEDKSTNYTMVELEDKLQEYEEWSQKLAKLLGVGRATQFTKHPNMKKSGVTSRRSWTS